MTAAHQRNSKAIMARSNGENIAANQIFSEDYHDYVFQGGKLVGDFDNMYRYAKEVPWNQDERCDHWYSEVGMLMVRDQGPYQTILEIGCGLGYVATKLRQFADPKDSRVDAFDLSPQAIEQAQSKHPGIGFYVDNIVDASFRPKQQYDLVVCRDLFWYTFDHMERVISNIRACVRPGGYLYVGQCFPALDREFVGKQVIPNPGALLDYLTDYVPVYTSELRNDEWLNDGPILHFLGRLAP